MLRPAFLFIAAALCAGAQDNALTAREQKEGWKLLFDGKSLSQWVDTRELKPAGDAWVIEDGCIKTIGHAQISEDLFSKQSFGDFELVFDWRISPGGNSGVKYRVQDSFWLGQWSRGERFEALVDRSMREPRAVRTEKGAQYIVAFEYQLTDDASNGDAKSNVKHTAGALYDMVAPGEKHLKPVGEFNRSRIVVRGNHVEHWLNGDKVVDSTLDSPAALEGITKRWSVAPQVLEMLSKQPRKKCPITLQNHGDVAWFKNLKIREL